MKDIFLFFLFVLCVCVEVWGCLDGNVPPYFQHRRQKVSCLCFCIGWPYVCVVSQYLTFFLQLLPTHPHHVLSRSYKVRFNSVSSYSDTRKSSSDEPETKANFESTGPLANVRWVRHSPVITQQDSFVTIWKSENKHTTENLWHSSDGTPSHFC